MATIRISTYDKTSPWQIIIDVDQINIEAPAEPSFYFSLGHIDIVCNCDETWIEERTGEKGEWVKVTIQKKLIRSLAEGGDGIAH
jgi:hypothetical protein